VEVDKRRDEMENCYDANYEHNSHVYDKLKVPLVENKRTIADSIDGIRSIGVRTMSAC
jgi:hypothetical protein